MGPKPGGRPQEAGQETVWIQPPRWSAGSNEEDLTYLNHLALSRPHCQMIVISLRSERPSTWCPVTENCNYFATLQHRLTHFFYIYKNTLPCPPINSCPMMIICRTSTSSTYKMKPYNTNSWLSAGFFLHLWWLTAVWESSSEQSELQVVALLSRGVQSNVLPLWVFQDHQSSRAFNGPL